MGNYHPPLPRLGDAGRTRLVLMTQAPEGTQVMIKLLRHFFCDGLVRSETSTSTRLLHGFRYRDLHGSGEVASARPATC